MAQSKNIQVISPVISPHHVPLRLSSSHYVPKNDILRNIFYHIFFTGHTLDKLGSQTVKNWFFTEGVKSG